MSCACHLLDTFNEKLKHLVEIVITFLIHIFKKFSGVHKGGLGLLKLYSHKICVYTTDRIHNCKIVLTRIHDV